MINVMSFDFNEVAAGIPGKQELAPIKLGDRLMEGLAPACLGATFRSLYLNESNSKL